ncbi:MAG: pentapeptide repeat-containing protein [Waterburya sp.]
MKFISLKRQALQQEFQKKYNSGERDFSNSDLREHYSLSGYFDEINLRGANLKGLRCGCVLYINADLSEANLEGVNFSRSYLMNANLSGANLKGANLRSADPLPPYEYFISHSISSS